MKTDTHADKGFDLGVLFVHGIGTQARGQTLTQFGAPLFRWIQSRCRATENRREASGASPDQIAEWHEQLRASEWGGELAPMAPPPDGRPSGPDQTLSRSAVLRETCFVDADDPAAPAHSILDIRSLEEGGRVTKDRWLLAESWWAEAFAAPTFAELARWSLRFVPWTIGSHFAARIRRQWNDRPSDSTTQRSPSIPSTTPQNEAKSRREQTHSRWILARWLWRTAAAILGFGLGLFLSIVILPLLAFMLLLGMIPIPRLRSALLSVQLRVAGVLGDCYVLLSRPIEAASIVGQVRRDLKWLDGRCKQVVVVAHSQGGAVAHLALRDASARRVRLLFTFGSGLRKLEELRQLEASGASFAFSAVLTAIAVGFFLLLASLLAFAAFTDQTASDASLITIAVYAVGTSVMCAAGIRDHLRGIQLPELDRWIEWLKASGVRWRDCYASADPVPNGLVTPAAADCSFEVCNQSSTLQDHTTYWSNSDEFISALYEQIAGVRQDDPLHGMALTKVQAGAVARRRRWRIALLNVLQWVGLAGVIAAIAVDWQAWFNFAAWSWQRGTGWIAALVGIKSTAAQEFTIAWGAAFKLAMILSVYWSARSYWRRWNEQEMHLALTSDGRSWTTSMPVAIGIMFMWIFGAGLVYGGVPPYWFLFPSFVVPSVIVAACESLRNGDYGQESQGNLNRLGASEDPASLVETYFVGAVKLFGFASAPFALGLSGWSALTWIAARLFNGEVLGLRPDAISIWVAGLVAMGLTALVWGVRLIWQRIAGKSDASKTPQIKPE